MLLTPPITVEQGGVFSREQALAAGFSYRRIRARVTAGAWLELGPKVLHAADAVVTPFGRIVAAALNTGRPISHWSAADVHRLDVPPARGYEPDDVHVTSNRALHVNVDGVVEHRTKLHAEDTVEIGQITVTSRTRTIIDLLAALPRSDAYTLLFRATQQGWLTAHDLDIAISRRPGRHGTPQLRQLKELLGTNAHAVSERLLHDLLAESDIPFDANVRLRLSDGVIAVVDVLVRGTRTVIEIDGHRWHSEADQFQRDRTRQNSLVTSGFTVLRFTWLDLTNRPDHVVSVIRDQLRLDAA
jgi:hypothetical protein